ncbi:hypothetical protein MYSTI_06892 [Myxococcus stipitatus DSM 14675]|uniref:T4 bacteriophage base plate protein n=1 Tax=Myxococcus stipitatus (strain DSM 14675 / JCM 12634 / Mx s8) TaxID=1278073 RepID=L7UJT1_MYXSD|nr:hypothetical protein [Myxococcus stipitatus]AGC48165.1 hypothetical protein MYSTI_06892 [Myxococcus stipitatus DSM 14675]
MSPARNDGPSPPGARRLVGPVRPLHAATLLVAWEQGQREGPVERALTLLGQALPETPREVLAALTIGERDGLLLALRMGMFGPTAPCVVGCPRCDETLELELSLADFSLPPPVETESVIRFEGLGLGVRAPTSQDLLEVRRAGDATALAAALLARCARVTEGAEPGALVPAHAAEAVAAEMARLDPQAELRLELSCAACSIDFSTVFDVVAYLWQEVETAAQRLLLEVDLLARSYGWSEHDILALTPTRRRAYLRLTGMA